MKFQSPQRSIALTRKFRFGILIALAVLFLLYPVQHRPNPPQTSPKPIVFTDDIAPDLGELALPDRKAEELKTVSDFKVFYQFHFTDRVKESGITFRQQIT